MSFTLKYRKDTKHDKLMQIISEECVFQKKRSYFLFPSTVAPWDL